MKNKDERSNRLAMLLGLIFIAAFVLLVVYAVGMTIFVEGNFTPAWVICVFIIFCYICIRIGKTALWKRIANPVSKIFGGLFIAILLSSFVISCIHGGPTSCRATRFVDNDC